MIKDRDDERVGSFAPDNLRRYCRIAVRNPNGASQQKIHQGTEAGIKILLNTRSIFHFFISCH